MKLFLIPYLPAPPLHLLHVKMNHSLIISFIACTPPIALALKPQILYSFYCREIGGRINLRLRDAMGPRSGAGPFVLHTPFLISALRQLGEDPHTTALAQCVHLQIGMLSEVS